MDGARRLTHPDLYINHKLSQPHCCVDVSPGELAAQQGATQSGAKEAQSSQSSAAAAAAAGAAVDDKSGDAGSIHLAAAWQVRKTNVSID